MLIMLYRVCLTKSLRVSERYLVYQTQKVDTIR